MVPTADLPDLKFVAEAYRAELAQSYLTGEAVQRLLGIDAVDVPPILSSTVIWSPIPQTKEIGREEAFFRRADHWLPA